MTALAYLSTWCTGTATYLRTRPQPAGWAVSLVSGRVTIAIGVGGTRDEAEAALARELRERESRTELVDRMAAVEMPELQTEQGRVAHDRDCGRDNAKLEVV